MWDRLVVRRRVLVFVLGTVTALSCGEPRRSPRTNAASPVLVGGNRPNDLRARVQLLGASANAVASFDGATLDYPDALGTGFDLVREVRGEIVEDFVRLPRPYPGSRVRYRIDTSGAAGLRLVARTLELLDARGAPRLRMEPPWIRDRSNQVHDASVRVLDCPVDEDPRGPWDRPVTAPSRTWCTVEVEWALDAGAYPALLDPGWGPCGDLANGRSTHAATLLANGRVLVSGGYSTQLGADVASAELFDPTTKTFAATSPLPSARRAHVTARLDDGRVVAIGGDAGLGTIKILGDIDRYDPTTGQWTSLPPLTTPRSHATVTKLSKSGEVVIVGGLTDYPADVATATVEICAREGTPCRGSTAMNEARVDHSATELADGRLLVAGGGVHVFNDVTSLHATSTVFDPSLVKWSNGPSLPAPRFGHTALRANNGTVFLVGGALSPQGESIASDVLAFEVGAASFKAAGTLKAPRWLHGSALLPSGKILTAGGGSAFYQPGTIATTETFDPVLGISQWTGDVVPTYFHGTTSLADGRVLLTGGGSTSAAQRGAWLYEEAKPPPDAGADAETDATVDASAPDAARNEDGAIATAAPSRDDPTGFYACAHGVARAPSSPLCGATLAFALLGLARRRWKRAPRAKID